MMNKRFLAIQLALLALGYSVGAEINRAAISRPLFADDPIYIDGLEGKRLRAPASILVTEAGLLKPHVAFAKISLKNIGIGRKSDFDLIRAAAARVGADAVIETKAARDWIWVTTEGTAVLYR